MARLGEEHGATWCGAARLGWARPGAAWCGKEQGVGWCGAAWRGEARSGWARSEVLGMAWRDEVWRGLAGQCFARNVVGYVLERKGKGAWYGMCVEIE